jgi:hypothetical protein
MKTVFIWTFALALFAVGTVLKGRKTEGMHAEPFRGGEQTRAMTAAFRDGTYLGKLAARDREPRHLSTSRWSSDEADRQAFAAGYERGYSANLVVEPLAVSSQSIDGAFRDGLYLGKLNARDGNEQHMASSRWSAGKDRASFIDGYHRAYAETSTVGMQQASGTEFLTLNARKP